MRLYVEKVEKEKCAHRNYCSGSDIDMSSEDEHDSAANYANHVE